MTAFEHDGQLILGGREMYMPLTHIANPREANFEVPFKYSIFRQIIEPFCETLYKGQLHYLDTFNVAYIPPGAGALYDATGRVRNSPLGDAFLSARRILLSANKRMLVDLRRVSDPEYRAELEHAGVKASPVNSRLSGPGITGHELLAPDIKPRRAPPRPKVARMSPFAGAVQLLEATPVQPPTPRARKTRRVRAPARSVGLEQPKPKINTAGVGLGVTAGVVAVTAATIVALDRIDEKKG